MASAIAAKMSISHWVTLPKGAIPVWDAQQEVNSLHMDPRPFDTTHQPINHSNLGHYNKVDADLEVEVGVGEHTKTCTIHQGLGSIEVGTTLWRVGSKLANFILHQAQLPTNSQVLHINAQKKANPKARAMQTRPNAPPKAPPPTVLELGAGTGLVSIIMAPLSKRLYATDQAEIIKLTTRNLVNNLSNDIMSEIVIVEPWQWGMEAQGGIGDTITTDLGIHYSQGQIIKIPSNYELDLILISDCSYNETVIDNLVEAMCVASDNDRLPVAILTMELRCHEDEVLLLETLLKSDFDIWRIPGETVGQPELSQGCVMYFVKLRDLFRASRQVPSVASIPETKQVEIFGARESNRDRRKRLHRKKDGIVVKLPMATTS